MFDVAVDEGREENPSKPFKGSGIDSELIKVEAEPDLEPEDEPDEQDEQQGISYDPRRKNKWLLFFQVPCSLTI